MFYNKKQYRRIRCGRANVCGSTRFYQRTKIYHQGSGSTEKGTYSFTLHFCKSYAMEILNKIRQVLRFLVDCLSPWIAMERRDDTIQHGETLDYNGCNRYQRRQRALVYVLSKDLKNVND